MATTLTASSAATQAGRESPGGGRLISLDIFRGMTIAGMILVNNAGNWDAVWWPLDHAAWNGWTPTDLIFPFFLFIVGVAMVLSFAARRAKGATRESLLRHALRRSMLIFLIGFALAFWGRSFNLHTVRIYGVLPRIAVVYLAASIIVLYCGRRTRLAIAAGLLVGYWLLMTRVPGFDLTIDGNLAGYLDRKLLYEHLWIAHRFDPEGVLSTFPAVATTLIGVFAGEWLRQENPRPSQNRARPGPPGKVQGMVMAAAVLMVAGNLWGRWFPINKNMWTSSYVLFTGGFALAALALCYWAVELRGWKKWGAPFVWYGSNAITLYAGSSALAIFTVKYHVHAGVTIKAWVYGHLFAPMARPMIASAIYASAYVLTFLVLAWVMHRNKIFIKV
jgi:predicted acyltransferase